MARVIPAIVALLLCADPGAIAPVSAQMVTRAPLARVRLPDTLDASSVAIRYFLTGPRGGYGGYVRTARDVHEYGIEDSPDVRGATLLKVIVYAPGHRVALLTVPLPGDGTVPTASVELEPLATVALSGRLVDPVATPIAPCEIQIDYVASWSHEFFGIMDGMVATFRIATVTVSSDGVFSAQVPDFVNDPAIASFADKGDFTFMARDPHTGNFCDTLEDVDHPGRPASIDVAPSYAPVTLTARTR